MTRTSFHVATKSTKFFCWILLLVMVSGRNSSAADQPVEFIVGGLMLAEGGTWQPAESPLLRPFGVDFDQHGRMFVVELEGGRVFRMDPEMELRQISGDGTESYNGDGGLAAKATYNGMHNVAVEQDGDVLIADSWNHCVRRIDAQTGIVSTIAGTGKKGFSGDDGPAVNATFDFVMCITLNPAGKVLHIADLNNRRIRAVDLATGNVTTVAGNGSKGIPADGSAAATSPLVDPRAVAADSAGSVYILERGGHALRVVRPDGLIHTVAGTGVKGTQDGIALQAQLNSPKHLCVDHRDRVIIADDENAAIRLFDPAAGTVSTVLGRGNGDARIRLLHPHGVCCEGDWIYVVDTGNNRILRMLLPAGR